MVAPKRVAENVWSAEVANWRPDLTVTVVAGTPAQRRRALASKADIHVIGRDNQPDVFNAAKAGRWSTLVLDELSGYKSSKSNRFKLMKRVRRYFPHVWGLTGTLAPNGLMDLWAQTYLLDGGERLGKTLTAYRTRFFYEGARLPSGVVTEWLLRPGAEKRIHMLLEDLYLSMKTDGRIQLPPVTHNVVEVPLPPKVRKLYKTMKNDLVVNLDILGGEVHTADTAAALSTKLSQICAGFMYHDDADLRGQTYDIIHHEKIRALEEIVNGTGSPVLVFYRFKAERDMVKAAFPKSVHTVEEPDLQARWNRGEFPILLAHPASIGHGLNLQHGGHTAVWLSETWNLEEYQQANKRLARQGQENPVVIHHLVSPGTVDKAIVDALERKKTIQDALMDHLESPL